MFLNEHDIDEAVDLFRRHRPALLPFALYLRDLKDAVNRQSDGWAYWRPPVAASATLQTLIRDAVLAVRYGGNRSLPPRFAPEVTDLTVWRKALAPIRAFGTRRRFFVPTLHDPRTPPTLPGVRP